MNTTEEFMESCPKSDAATESTSKLEQEQAEWRRPEIETVSTNELFAVLGSQSCGTPVAGFDPDCEC